MSSIRKMTVMLDSNAVDKLALDRSLRKTLVTLKADGLMSLYVTGVLKNEIGQIADERRKQELLNTLEEISADHLPVEYAPYGYAYGECYGGRSPDLTLNCQNFIGNNMKHIEDAMIAATASSKKYRLDFVVTDDDTFQKKLNRQQTDTKAIGFDEFKARVEELSPIRSSSDLPLLKEEGKLQ